jgi:hypothetical protein
MSVLLESSPCHARVRVGRFFAFWCWLARVRACALSVVQTAPPAGR